MLSYKWCICTFVALFLAISSIAAHEEEYVDDDDYQIEVSARNNRMKWLNVDQSGKKGFKTIQAAIDSIPPNNQKWIGVFINEGIYKEHVTIPLNKPFVYLKGAGKYLVTIISDDIGPIDQSATFISEADNIIAKHITFTNGYSYRTPTPSRARALAARIRGDKSAFFECGFYGLQDTLWDDKGRHYFKSCAIEGAVDFIFGNGQSQYEDCTISILSTKGTVILDGSSGGYITAQGRGNAEETTGFVFKSGYIVGKGKAYLGRPWRENARVLYYKTEMNDIIVPQGWSIWDKAGKESQLSLSEYQCTGPGAKSSRRVAWEKKLSEAEVKQLTDISFIDGDGWVQNALNMFANN